MAYRLPLSVPSRLSIPLPATRSTIPSRPYRFTVSLSAVRPTSPSRPFCFPVSSRAVRPTFPPRQCHFPASLRAVRPTFPFVRPFSRCVVRYSLGVSSRPSRLPFCPLLRSLRSPLLLSLFQRVVMHSTNNIAFRRFARQTVTLGFGLTHLCCVVVCVCVLL